MAIRFMLEDNLGTPAVSRNLALNGIDVDAPTTEVQQDRYYWRWADDPTMEPQFLAEGVAGQNVSAPFDTQGRSVVFYRVSYDQKGQPTATHPRDGEQFVYVPPTAPQLASAVFSTPHVNLTFVSSGGTGDIRILRRTGTNDFAQIATAAFTDTAYADSPSVNATYDYKLIQDGQVGESAIQSATVTGISAGAGSPPDTLAGTWDTVNTVTLTWANHSGTGLNHIERRANSIGTWEEIDTVAAGTATYDDTDAGRLAHPRTLYYRVRNDSVLGYSDQVGVLIAGL
jgi:hypothetical protein